MKKLLTAAVLAALSTSSFALENPTWTDLIEVDTGIVQVDISNVKKIGQIRTVWVRFPKSTPFLAHINCANNTYKTGRDGYTQDIVPGSVAHLLYQNYCLNPGM